MNVSTLPAVARTVPRAGLLDRTARNLLFSQLAHLKWGRLTVRDGALEQTFGVSAADAADVCVTVLHPRFYRQIVAGGSLAAGETYLEGDWSCDDLTGLIRIFIRNQQIAQGMDRGLPRLANLASRCYHWMRRNTRLGSQQNIQAHYDLGNEFFSLFLDETMMYSCGIFDNADSTMHDASLSKLTRICRKLELQPRDHLLEIGTGWGSLAIHAASQYGCQVTTATISPRQFEFASRRVREAGLEDKITVILRDYRDLEGTYDKLVSVEMIEAVGHSFLDGYFRKCFQLLKPHGLMLLQGIVMQEQSYQQYLHSVDFIQRYIFPGGCLPSVLAMGQSIARTSDMRFLHLEDLAPHYSRTLRCWRARFMEELEEIRRMGYSERFIRTWEYYFRYCEAAFDERFVGVVQLLLGRSECRHDSLSVSL